MQLGQLKIVKGWESLLRLSATSSRLKASVMSVVF